MLVDLARNDLGRVCVPGTVEVTEFRQVERYSHVMHLVSTVSGTLRDDKHALDAVTACFPAGTLTGAPKVRAMELIEANEKTRRGLYGGIVGYLDFAGDADTSRVFTGEALGEVDLVVEAIAEEIGIKNQLFADLDRICKPGAILATTTSSLSIADLAAQTKRPQDVVGMHFFNPAPIMKLVEVINHPTTGQDVLDTVQDLCRSTPRSPSAAPTAPASSSTRCSSPTSTTPSSSPRPAASSSTWSAGSCAR